MARVYQRHWQTSNGEPRSAWVSPWTDPDRWVDRDFELRQFGKRGVTYTPATMDASALFMELLQQVQPCPAQSRHSSIG